MVQCLKTLPGVRDVQGASPEIDLYADHGGSLVPEVVSLASSQGVDVYDVHISEPSLENLSLHLTGRSLRE